MKKSILIALALTVSLGATCPIEAAAMSQDNKKQEKPMSKAELRRIQKAEDEARQKFVIDSILSARSYSFVAERVITGQYDRILTNRSVLIVEGTKLFSQLPYYGTSSAASYGTSTSPLEFESVNINYQAAPLTNKKGGKEFVLIRAIKSNATTAYTIGLEIFDNGSATLSMEVSGGIAQTFYGYIEPTVQK